MAGGDNAGRAFASKYKPAAKLVVTVGIAARMSNRKKSPARTSTS